MPPFLWLLDAEAGLRPHAQRVERLALAALLSELACHPKPGLVSLYDSGSHADMDATTFLRSAVALKGYFAAMAEAGAAGAGFAELNALGRAAEAGMLRATGGINTHRGAVFALGLLAAAAGGFEALPADEGAAETVALEVSRRWGHALATWPGEDGSHGARVRQRYGVAGARHEAAAGFPALRHHALPAYRAARRCGASPASAGVDTLCALMAVLEDTNLLHRGGREGLDFARAAAADFLAQGGIGAPGGHDRALGLHAAFVARRLSPGGAADLLAATYFLASLTGP